jgi:hypothetical protein
VIDPITPSSPASKRAVAGRAGRNGKIAVAMLPLCMFGSCGGGDVYCENSVGDGRGRRRNTGLSRV